MRHGTKTTGRHTRPAKSDALNARQTPTGDVHGPPQVAPGIVPAPVAPGQTDDHTPPD